MERMTFESIAGYTAAKEELKRICDLLNDRDKAIKKGAKFPKGLILYGAAGTGKTLFAKVLADECELPFIVIDITDTQTTEDICIKIKQAFTEAKKNEYSIIFLDEIDKILPDENRDYTSDQSRRVLTQLLTLIDGIKSDNNVFFVATCNDYYSMPHTVVRAGRIDKKIFLSLPDLESRTEILTHYIGGTKCSFEMPVEKIAKLCNGFSVAEIETFVNECALCSDENNVVNSKLVYKVLSEIANQNICEDSEIRNTKLEAVHSVGHFIVAQMLHPSNYVLNCDNDFCGNSFFYGVLNNCIEYDDDDDDYDDYDDDDDNDDEEEDNCEKCDTYSAEDYFDLIAVLIAGQVAERIFMGKIYPDCRGDYVNIENTLQNIELNGFLGIEYYEWDNYYRNPCYQMKLFSKREEIVKQAISRAEEIINGNRKLCDYLVSVLLKNVTVEDADLEPLIQMFSDQFNS